MTHNHLDEQDEDDTDNDILQDGERIHVGMMFRDGLSPIQQAVAADSEMRSMRLVDGHGQPVTGNKPGYAFLADTDEVSARRRAAARDFAKAELSAQWRGGLQDGDHVMLDGQRMQVVGRNPTTGKLLLSDASGTVAKSAKQSAHEDYEHDLTNAWKRHNERDSRRTTQRDPQGRERATFTSEREKEWALGGPLSDATEAQAVKQHAYDAYADELVNAWRRP